MCSLYSRQELTAEQLDEQLDEKLVLAQQHVALCQRMENALKTSKKEWFATHERMADVPFGDIKRMKQCWKNEKIERRMKRDRRGYKKVQIRYEAHLDACTKAVLERDAKRQRVA